MFQLIRGFIFSLFFIIWTIVWGVVCLPALFLKKNHIIFQKIGYIWAKITLLKLKLICNIKYKIIGNIPQKTSIIASKHQSAWETIFFLYLFKNPVFIIKRELTKIPIYGWYLEKMGMITIDRMDGISSIKQIKEQSKKALEQSRNVIIFPEGTRGKPSQDISYRSGIVFLYQTYSDDYDVIPVALNSGKYWINKSIVKKLGTIKVKILPPLPRNIPRNDILKILKNDIDENSEML